MTTQAAISSTWPQQLLARHISKGKGNKSKNKLLGLYQDKKKNKKQKTFAQQRKQSTNLKATYEMREDIYKWHIR